MTNELGTTESECPIGLICSMMECQRSICERYSEPWDLPYLVHPRWEPEASIFVTIEQFDEEGYGTCWEQEHRSEYNSNVARIRQELFLAGWWNGSPLPYTIHPDGGIVVTEDILIGVVGFYCEVCYSPMGRLLDPSDPEGFYRPIPVDGISTEHKYLNEDGYSPILYWAYEFEDWLYE